MESKPYLQYLDKFKKVNLFNLILSACSLIMVFVLLFVPVLQTTKSIPLSELPLNLLGQLTQENIKNGQYVFAENFSIVDGLIDSLQLTLNGSGNDAGVALLFCILPFSTVLTAFSSIVQCGKSIYNGIRSMQNPEEYAMIEYAQISKNDNKYYVKLYQSQRPITITIMYFCFSIVFNFFFLKMFEATSSLPQLSYFANFSGLSGFIVVDIVFLAIFVVSKTIFSRTYKELSTEIVKNGYTNAD
ncbi:MAG: hypothetical protein J6Q52_05715 [Clostridia bacterium]|nr:hypothetical protein [Clostridia bacterium]